MHILKAPKYSEDMTAGISLTGITKLNDSIFKTRHGGSKSVIWKPKGELLLKKNDLQEKERLAQLKPKRKKKVELTVEPIKPIRKKGKYQVNKKEVSHRIRNMVNQMKGEKKLYFWTITFPDNTTDDTAFILFNKWLTRCRRDLKLKSYIWVAERQDGKRLKDKSKAATNTIHFHIAIHQRMCVKKANKFMRACLFTCIDNKEIIYTREAAKNYNGVDIAKDRKTRKVINFALKNKGKSLSHYLTKYVTKNDSEFKHLAYHCSRDYSNLILNFRLTDAELDGIYLDEYLDTKEPFVNEWITFYRWKKQPPDIVCKYLAFVNQVVINLVNKN